MRSIRQKLLTLTLLAAYFGLTVIGEGLHSLLPGHNHDIRSNVVTHTAHSHGCGHHSHGSCCHSHGQEVADHDHSHAPAGPIVFAVDGDIHSHACHICAFLSQAVSEPLDVVTVPDLHPLVTGRLCVASDQYVSALIGLHSARGPPQHSA